ncbi:hypothetical protein Dimus_020261 [Dionaea muscipula]
MTLASILDIPGNNGICDYVKEVFEESKYCNPLEITRKFANDDTIAKARRLPYGELLTRIFHAFEVPLNDKEAEQHVAIDKFKDTILNMCGLRRENGVWWLGSGANRRGDEEVENEEEVAPAVEQVEEDAEVEGQPKETEAEVDGAGSGDKFYDAEEGETATAEDTPTPAAQPYAQQQGKTTDSAVDPSGHIPDYDLLHLQDEFSRALQTNTRF